MKKIILSNLLLLISASLFAQYSNGSYRDWQNVGDTGVSNMTVRALAVTDSTANYDVVYAGGDFKAAGKVGANYVAKYCSLKQNWYALGSGTNGSVRALAILKGKLYAGGLFDSAGGMQTKHIASCDTLTNQWDSLTGGVNGNVYALTVFNGNLYVGGSFTMAGGVAASNIAMWNGTSWSAVGAGFDNTVYALTVCNDTLYVGGAFMKSGGLQVSHIAAWAGTKWDSLIGLNDNVYALCSEGNALFVGGAFTMAGSTTVNHLASWVAFGKRYQWQMVASGTNDTVFALNQAVEEFPVIIKPHQAENVNGNCILAGGVFTQIGGVTNSAYIAAVQGTSGFTPIGGIDGPVYAIGVPGNTYEYNYVGGSFYKGYEDMFKDSLVLNYIGILTFGPGGGGFSELHNNNIVSVYPNPSKGVFNFIANGQQLLVNSKIEVYNMLGENIATINSLPSGGSGWALDLSGNPSGVYLYRILDNNGFAIATGKLVVDK